MTMFFNDVGTLLEAQLPSVFQSVLDEPSQINPPIVVPSVKELVGVTPNNVPLPL